MPVLWQIGVAERGPDANGGGPAHVWHLSTAHLGLAPAPAPRERSLATLASLQRGAVTRSQLLELGFSGSAIDRRVLRGALHPLLPGVYAVGHEMLAPLAAETAALLYIGDDCVLSHASAAAVWGLGPAPAVVAVTRIGVTSRRQARLVVHRAEAIDIRDVTIHHGLPLTTPARTLLDRAAEVRISELERVLAEIRVQGLATDAELLAVLDRYSRRSGTGKLRALLRSERSPAMTRSEAERALRRLVSAAELPEPLFNVRLHGMQIDALWSAQRLAVEVDGYPFHGHRAAFERDRRRDQRLAAAGYTVIRITWRQLRDEPMAVAVRLAQALASADAAAGRGADVADRAAG
ncbi:MAG: DUF559 domain-containing protein [Solirubrobacteraceae bacterium]